MADEIVVRQYRAGDETAINAGFNRVFGLHRPLEDWLWKYQAEPEGRWIYIAEDASRNLLAYYGALPVRMRAGDFEFRAGQPVDVYSQPEVRRTKVFTNCYEEFIAAFGRPEALPVMFGFPGGVHFEMGLKLLKYVLMGKVPYWRRERGPGVALPAFGYQASEGFDGLAIDELWRRAEHRYRYGAIRNQLWLRRRYTGRPVVDYRHFVVRRRGTPCAWAVAVADRGRLRWADLVWDGREGKALEVLDRAIFRFARDAQCEASELWLGGDHDAAEVLHGVGWRREPHPDNLHMVARCFDPRVDLAELAEKMYVTLGDSDLV